MLNKVQLIGNLGQDPEVRYLNDGNAVANFSLATSESYKDKDGNTQTNTEWHNIVAWGGTAKLVEKYLNKGDRIYLEGSLKTEKWESDQGTRYKTTVRVKEIKFLTNKNEHGGSASAGSQRQNTSASTHTPPPIQPIDGDGEFSDLPF